MKTQKISIKTNFLLNLARVLSTALITIFTMPYINRVLGAEYVGKIEYVFIIIYYFILFSALGIPIYGIREVSKCRDDPKKLYMLVLELMIILLITTIISYLIIFGVLIYIPFFIPYKTLIFILCGMIFLNSIGAEWYFQGLENQKFITIRNLIIKIIVFILLFLLIKKQSDYEKYAFLLVVLWYGANIVGFIFVGKKIYYNRHLISLKEVNLKRHYKPVLTVFITTVSLSIYLQLANFFIGTIAGDKYVGYYTTANALIRNVITFISVIGSVMLPRLSYLYVNDKIKYDEYLKKTFHFMMIMAVPCTVYFFIFSQNIILLMGGKQFLEATLTMKILSPLCVVVSFAYFFGLLVLYPQGLERIYTKATVVSAFFSIIAYFFVIKKFQHNGAAIIVVVSEFLSIFYMAYYIVKNKIIVNYLDVDFMKILFINIFIGIIIYILNDFLIPQNLVTWAILTAAFGLLYGILLIILKEKNTLEIYYQICDKLNKIKIKNESHHK
ncbi:flippase [Chryseobacterium sp. S-02]|uniref:flippase n=1 Tax=Chryseobacterium sp. S-02 TaxID=3404064 RepID=UPI003CF9B6D2